MSSPAYLTSKLSHAILYPTVARSKLRPPEKLIKDTWQIYAKNWVFLIKALFISIALVFPLVLGFIPPATAALAAIFAKQKMLLVILAIIFFLAFILLSLIIGSWSQTFLYQAAYQAGQGKQVSIRKMLRLAWQKWFSFFLSHLYSGLLIFLGLILLIVPGIIFAIWFSLVSYVVVIEKTGPVEALKRSRKLVENHFWAVLGRMALILFLSILATAIFSKFKLIGGIANFLLSPFWLMMNYLIYKDLAKIKPA